MPSKLGRPLPGMTGASQADLSFEGIFQILDGIPPDRLIQYRHKLSCSHQDQRSCHLLHVIILMCLGREDEARVHLNGLRDDVVANHLFQSHWGKERAKRTSPEELKDHAKVARTVAEIFSLLVDEKLCQPQVRDEAYRAAIQAFQASNIQGAELKGLLDEAMDKCGPQFISTVPGNNVGALVSARWGLTPHRRSNPIPIEGSSPPDNPQSLRSTGSPVCDISNLKMSETSTALSSSYNIEKSLSIPPAGQEEDTSSSLLGKGFSTHSRKPCLSNPSVSCSLPDPQNTRSPKASAQCPTQCVPTPKTAPSEDLLPAFQTPSLQTLGSVPSTGDAPQPGPYSSAPAPITSLGPLLPSSSSSSSSSDLASCSSGEPSSVTPPAEERQFYTFVVLHAAEDELVACRVKERLEGLGVSNGATFSEDFLVPGCCQLNCFQNALDNSAFTLLLLTQNFKGRLCAYQRNTALMDSFTRFCKKNSVIPFVPQESSLKSEEMPLLLASLVPLREKSAVFARRVKKTFTPRAIREKKAAWDLLRRIQEEEERQEREREDMSLRQHLSALSLQPPAVDISRLQAPSGHTNPLFPISTTSLLESGPDQASLSQPFMFSVGCPSTTAGPQLIIQNAQMVQIGDYNHMQVERSQAAIGRAEDEIVDRSPVMERETSPRD